MRTTTAVFEAPILLALLAATHALPARADEAALAARVDKMAAELEALKAELQTLKAEKSAPATGTVYPEPIASGAGPSAMKATIVTDTGAQTPLPFAMAPGTPLASTGPGTTGVAIFGYGEINYANYPRDRAQTQADLARAVFGIGYRFRAE